MIKLKQNIGNHLFYMPALILFIFYIISPAIFQIYFGLIEWEGMVPLFNNFTLSNYTKVFKQLFGSSRSILIDAFKHNIIFTMLVGLIQNTLAFLIAFLFSYKIRDKQLIKRNVSSFFRTIYFVPTLIAVATLGIVWTYILNRYGVLNQVWELMGLDFLIVDWLGNKNFALLSIVLVNSWQYFGMTTLLFFAGFEAIPNELIEAADIDGANIFQKIKSIFVPLLAPTITIITVLTIVGSFKLFDLPYVMTKSGPAGATDVIMTLIVREGIRNRQYGYGNAASTLLFMFLIIITALLLKFLRSREEKNA